MAKLTDALRAWRKRRDPDLTQESSEGQSTVLDGRAAAREVEALLSTRVEPGGLAAAIGSALAGRRAGAFLGDFEGARDLMELAASRHVPLVAHGECRVSSAERSRGGTGHDGLRGVIDSGLFLLFPRNVQEVVDLTIVARLVSERSLVPGLLAMDSEETARAMQDVRLPSAQLVRELAGEPGDEIECPTPAQEILFGGTRRRVSPWFDLDRPTLQGALHGVESWSQTVAARRPYFFDPVARLLAEACETVSRRTGREISTLSTYAVEDADFVLVAQGSAVEIAEASCERLRSAANLKVGVIGVRCLRPFPAEAIAGLLRGRRAVVTLERSDVAMSDAPPLLSEIRAVAVRALENGRWPNAHEGHPSWKEKDLPRMHAVRWAPPLGPADLIALCQQIDREGRAPTYLGLDFLPPAADEPKRQVLLDRIRRHYPAVQRLGLRSDEEFPDMLPEGAVTVAVHGGDECVTTGLVQQAASLFHRVNGGRVRSRLFPRGEPWAPGRVERFTLGDAALKDPGDAAGAHIAVVLSGGSALSEALAGVTANGSLLVLGGAEVDGLVASLTVAEQQIARDRNVTFYSIDPGGEVDGLSAESVSTERVLGALVTLMRDRGRTLEDRAARSAREHLLKERPESEREGLLEAFAAGIANARWIEAEELFDPSRAPAPAPEWEAPYSVRHLGRSDLHHDSLARFWDQVGVLYREQKTSALAPDPYLAVGTIPPLSSTFRDFTNVTSSLPAFDPVLCTGCGECWTACPDGAVGPVAIGAGAALEAGMAAARKRGEPVEVLRSVASKLAARVNTALAAEPIPTTLAEAFTAAFTSLVEKTAPPEDRKSALAAALKAVLEEVGELPIARTEPFFDEPESQKKGTGDLLAIAINADACKACGVCAAVCEPDALNMGASTAAAVADARRLWRLWEELPDTPGETIARLRAHPLLGEAAALLLSRHALLAEAGGDDAEAGSGEKMALRLALGAAESVLQPAVLRRLEELDELREMLAKEIRASFADALPIGDLDALAQGLQALGRREVDLASLAGRVDQAFESERVDGAKLARFVAVAQDVADLRQLLVRGPGGVPRARYGMVLAGETVARWAAAFPYNPFSVPVTVSTGSEAAALAGGLMDGLQEGFLKEIQMIRRARRTLENPSERETATVLSWDELTDEERHLCPPLFVVADESACDEAAARRLLPLLSAGRPLKILVIADPEKRRGSGDLGLAALAQRRAFVLQSSIAAPDHLVAGVAEALNFEGPALLRIHGPSPSRHGFAAQDARRQAHLAVNSRAFPLFRYDPRQAGVFGTRLDLSGNRDLRELWVKEEGRAVTPADWAAGESRFAARFSPLAEGEVPTPLDEYLNLGSGERARRAPVVEGPARGEGPARRLRVSPSLVAAAREAASVWRVLQELAGVESPFTQRLREEASEEVAAARESETKELQRDYERRLGEVGDHVREEMADTLQRTLMQLAGYGAENDGGASS